MFPIASRVQQHLMGTLGKVTISTESPVWAKQPSKSDYITEITKYWNWKGPRRITKSNS